MTTFKESVKQYIYSYLFLLGFMGFLYLAFIVNLFYLSFSLLILILILAMYHDKVIDFFTFLMERIPKKNKNGKNNYWYVLVYLTFFFYNKLFIRIYSTLMTIYPFSILHRQSQERATERWMDNYRKELEEFTRKNKVPLIVTSISSDSNFSTFYSKQECRISKEKYLKRLEIILEKKYKGCYVRDDKNGFRLLIPTEIVWRLTG